MKKSTPKTTSSSTSAETFEDHESMVAQLNSLYSERERLYVELGVSDAESIIKMVQSLTAQLEALYKQKEGE